MRLMASDAVDVRHREFHVGRVTYEGGHPMSHCSLLAAFGSLGTAEPVACELDRRVGEVVAAITDHRLVGLIRSLPESVHATIVLRSATTGLVLSAHQW